MPKPFNLDRTVDEFRRITAELTRENSPASGKQLERRADELRAAYVEWNGGDGDEFAEIAADE